MTIILNNLLFSLNTSTEYILDNLITIASLLIEEVILLLITTTGFIALISLAIFLEGLIFESIVEDIKAINFKRNSAKISENIRIKLDTTNELIAIYDL